ncbi:MAG: sulfite exporter TauE/SafE family protein [Roseibium sp.]|uniref:sulfite exporter TauE/SafE family protein n=1 Tax=Roseibium sp. TaxID=1936156 RepID=UPI001B23A674|nr:sulfite exporter TauE/SafE family protein [Roseibium sp.]MBO6892065.1 sulfite exporter TauE/SafE family protein [Roseibium sp.]MBO6929348.1 sulfite exporter TauE/SafE family protein [Roseibium sp.]
MDLLTALLPADISLLASLLLIVASFFTSALTAAVGLGGGIALIAVMASLMPASALVPVHGVVQIGSNGGRAIVQFRHVDWLIAVWFAAGAVFGAAIGGAIAVELPASVLRAGIGVFVLWVIWGRPPRFGKAPKRAMGVAGFASTFLSMFFGAAGPIGGAVLSTLGLTRHEFVANQAVTALTMHIFKIIAFGALGFAFAPWVGLIVLMIASGFLGTLAGSRMLGKMDEKAFKTGFKWVMTALALNLFWQAFRTWF